MWCLEVLLTLPTFERTGRTIDKRDARWVGAPAEFSRFVSEPPADDNRGGWNGRVCRERAFWCSKASARSSASFKSPFCLRHRRSSPGEAPMGGCSIFLWLGTDIFEMYAKSQLKPAAGRNCDDMSVWPVDVSGRGHKWGQRPNLVRETETPKSRLFRQTAQLQISRSRPSSRGIAERAQQWRG